MLTSSVFARCPSSPKGAANHRNGKSGKSGKTVLTDAGALRIEVPRDPEGTFEPELIGKHERRFTGFDDKIIAMYARGIAVRESQGFLAEMYAIDVSPDLISRVTDEVMSEVAPRNAVVPDSTRTLNRMDEIIGGVLGVIAIQSGRVVVWLVSFGKWRGEPLSDDEGSLCLVLVIAFSATV